MSMTIKKVYSDNPYVDELVYYTLQLTLHTTLKIKQQAEDYETLDILKKAEIYLSCLDGNASLKMFDDFPFDVLTSTTDKSGLPYGAGLSAITATNIHQDTESVFDLSKAEQKRVLTAMMKYYSENYVEENTYYRALNGLPPLGSEDIYVDPSLIPSNVNLDLSKPVHELDDSTISILYDYGILDDLYEEDPKNRMFLQHMGTRKIDIYHARKARMFETLYVPSIDSTGIRDMYLEKLENNRNYVMRAVYSEAYKYNSDYYDNVMAIFIILITMIDIISRVQEFITRKEIFDIRSCEYLFDSYGVEFFEDIPLRYQIAMVKNIHTLLKYKSTSQCMIDICSLFGFDNIKVYKYYLMKDHNVDLATGEYKFDDDDEDQYTLKFIKLPLEDNVNDYIRVASNHIDYDELTEGDAKWDGGLDHTQVKQEILKQEFNIVRTKYISIDTVYDIAKRSAEQTYFFNMLYDNYEVENLLRVRVPFIDSDVEFEISDVFSLLTALSYYYNNIKDIILSDQQTVLAVNGFNFKADMAALAADLNRTGHTLHAMEQLQNFEIPEGQIPSFEQLMAMYANNLDIREELVQGMADADNLRVFLVYKKLYDSLMTVELNFDHFKNPETNDFYRDTEGDATYTEYFRNTAPELYYILVEADSFTKDSDRKQWISNQIDNIVMALENYIDFDKYPSLLANLPAVSAEAVKLYIAEVINFYKSYKVDFLGLNTIYYLDDKLEGAIRIIDDIRLERNFTKNTIIELIEKFGAIDIHLTKRDAIKLLDVAYMDRFIWDEKDLDETISLTDAPYTQSKLSKYSVVQMNECIYDIHTLMEPMETIKPIDLYTMHVTKSVDDRIALSDVVTINTVYE